MGPSLGRIQILELGLCPFSEVEMRKLILIACTIIGAGCGLALDVVWAVSSGNDIVPIIAAAGLVVGLLVGLVVARLAYPSRRQREWRQGPRIIDINKEKR
jgi:membrane associated rhomboid family serine protease